MSALAPCSFETGSGSDLSGALPFPMRGLVASLDADFGIPLSEKMRTRDSCEVECEEIYRGLRISVLELDTVLSVLVRKLDTALGGGTCAVGVEGRGMGCCLASNGGVEGDEGCSGRILVMIFGRRGGVAASG